MCFKIVKNIRLKAKGLLLVGGFLIIVNITGFFCYKTINKDNINLIDEQPRTVSEKNFWNQAYKEDSETVREYVERLTELVSDRMLAIDSKYTKPTIYENWILWAFAQYLGFYEWIDTKKAVRMGGGFCSQMAIVFNNILREQGIKSRILALNGHVLNEVLIERRWQVYDPEFNVVFNASLDDLEKDPDRVYQAYKNAGRPNVEAKHWEEIFATDADNKHFENTRDYKKIKSILLEKTSFYLIWLLPIAMIFFGILIMKQLKK